jgi:hypothetical protein
MIQVPGLTLKQLEERANKLLFEYAETIDTEVPTPIPVVEIAENHLALDLSCADVRTLLNLPRKSSSSDVLGAMIFERQQIVIDDSLNPEKHPFQMGRYRYSVGHEIGHWVLHRAAAMKKMARVRKPVIVCREVAPPAKVSIVEWQADHFSSFLLLPRQRVLEAWGESPPAVFDVHKSGSTELRRLWTSLRPDPEEARALYAIECQQFFDRIALPLATTFAVSLQAMRIRLEALGVLQRVGGAGA